MAQLIKSSLHTQIAHILAQRILRGDLKPGDGIPNIDHLRAEFGVSRTVLREAIKLLTAKGLVESRPRIGMSVRSRGDWSMLDPDVLMWRVEAGFDIAFFNDLIGMRRVIEPGAAELAASSATDAELTHLDYLYRQLEVTVEKPDLISAAIVAITQITTLVPGSSRHGLMIHKAVLASIQARDPNQANHNMHLLLEEMSEAVEQILRLTHQEMDAMLQKASREIGSFLNKQEISQ